MDRKTVIFLHIPKAAGSTLNRILAQQAPPAAILKVGGASRAETQASVAAAKDACIITGHQAFGLHTSVPGPSTYITVVRDPVRRFLSHFRYASQLPKHRMHDAVKSGSMSLRDAAQRLSDLQTRYIAGDRVPVGAAPDEATLEIAKENLEQHFSAVGIAERFDESLVLMQRRLGWTVRPYTNSNVSRDGNTTSKPSEEDMATIRDCNRIDQMLYNWALERFEREIAGEGATFSKEVADLRWKNRLNAWTRGLLGSVFKRKGAAA